jgi:hypothetical protein
MVLSLSIAKMDKLLFHRRNFSIEKSGVVVAVAVVQGWECGLTMARGREGRIKRV